MSAQRTPRAPDLKPRSTSRPSPLTIDEQPDTR